LLLVYEKLTGRFQAKFSGDHQTVEGIYQNNPNALERLAGVYVSDQEVPAGDIRRFKWDGVGIAELTEAELEEPKNPLIKKLEQLEQENALLYSAIAELSILLGGGSS